MTVLGPVEPSTLGPTLVHEHLLIDLRDSSFVAPPAELAGIADARVSDVARSVVARYSCSVRDNLVLDDLDLAAAELARFRAVLGGTVVDVTPVDIGRSPERLRGLAEQTGVAIVMGCGHYCEIAYGAEVASLTEDELTEELLQELVHGVGETGIRPGIIGELGVNGEERSTRRRVGEMTAAERRSLRAGARAAIATGAPLTVHLPSRAEAVPEVLDVLDEVGVPLERVSLSHMDTIPDVVLHEEAIDRGVWIQYDCFGMALENDWYADPGDDLRCDWLGRHRETGRLSRVLVSHDVWCKAQLHAHGGGGYSYVLTQIVPRLRSRGFGEDDVAQLLVRGPAAFLTWGEGAP